MKPYETAEEFVAPICASCDKIRPKEGLFGKEKPCDWEMYHRCPKLRNGVWKKMTKRSYTVDKKVYVDIAGVPTPMEPVNEYINHIVARIKECKIKKKDYGRECHFGELEKIRVRLHGIIVCRVGFMMWDPSNVSYIYRDALETYIEWRITKMGVFEK